MTSCGWWNGGVGWQDFSSLVLLGQINDRVIPTRLSRYHGCTKSCKGLEIWKISVWALRCSVSTIFPMFAGWLFMKVVGAHLPDIHIYKIVAPRETHNSSFRDFCQVSCGTDWTSANLGFPISGVRWDDKRFVTFYRFKINLNNRDWTDIRYSDSRGRNQDKWSETPNASVNNLVKQKV